MFRAVRRFPEKAANHPKHSPKTAGGRTDHQKTPKRMKNKKKTDGRPPGGNGRARRKAKKGEPPETFAKNGPGRAKIAVFWGKKGKFSRQAKAKGKKAKKVKKVKKVKKLKKLKK